MAWQLMQLTPDGVLASQRVGARSFHDINGWSTRQKAERVLLVFPKPRIAGLMRDILLARAEHDPGGFRLEGVDQAGVHRVYFFQQVPDDS